MNGRRVAVESSTPRGSFDQAPPWLRREAVLAILSLYLDDEGAKSHE